MTTATKPEWLASDYADYDDIVKGWGFNIMATQTFGSYQGDHAYLLASPTGLGYGLVVFGYGSCSGCDQLESIMSEIGYSWSEERDQQKDWQPLIDFANSLRESVHWEATLEQLVDWIMDHPENNWWSYDREIADWLNKVLGTTLKGSEDW